MLYEYIVVVIVVVFVLSYVLFNFFSKCGKNISVVVLGDLGRSPRMQYHCISLAREGFNVDVIAYYGSKPHSELLAAERVEIYYMTQPPAVLSRLPRLLNYALKTLWQSITLAVNLLLIPKAAFHMVQNPPTIPTLAVVYLVCLIRSSRLLVDWHNYGYTLLSLSLHVAHPLVRFSKWFERYFGQFAFRSICVTKAMQSDLSSWNIKSKVLYDRPPEIFKTCDVTTSHQIFTKLSTQYPYFAGQSHEDTLFTEIYWDMLGMTLRGESVGVIVHRGRRWSSKTEELLTSSDCQQYCRIYDLSDQIVSQRQLCGLRSTFGSDEDTLFTEVVDGRVKLKDSRPALVVSSTSWTEDEDFSILLDALQNYETEATNSQIGKNLPNLLIVITGKGPLKEHYRHELSKRHWDHVTVCLPWLEAADYPLLLGSADLGVCLHQSSSGLDLPMKVVDMFGCGLPVCAVHFSCLDELVQHGDTGLVFYDADQLSHQIMDLLQNFPREQQKLAAMRLNLVPFRRQRWHDNWSRVVLPLLTLDS